MEDSRSSPRRTWGNTHERVVNRIDQRVQRRTVRAGDNVVRLGFGLEGDLTANKVVPGPILVRHAKAPDRLAAFGLKGVNLFLGEVCLLYTSDAADE